jgi:signal transduction histidine kinase
VKPPARTQVPLARSTEYEQARDDVAVVIDELHRLRRLTTELLRFEVVTGTATFAPVDTAVEPVLRTVLHRWAFADRHWRLDVPSGTRALIDRGRLEPAFDAIVDNAVRHTRRGDGRRPAQGGPTHGDPPGVTTRRRPSPAVTCLTSPARLHLSDFTTPHPRKRSPH